MNQFCIELNCGELFSTIVERRSSDDRNEVQRAPRSQLHLVSEWKAGIGIDRYCPARNLWTNVRLFDTQIELVTVICRGGKVMLIGGRDEQRQILSSVSIYEILFEGQFR